MTIETLTDEDRADLLRIIDAQADRISELEMRLRQSEAARVEVTGDTIGLGEQIDDLAARVAELEPSDGRATETSTDDEVWATSMRGEQAKALERLRRFTAIELLRWHDQEGAVPPDNMPEGVAELVQKGLEAYDRFGDCDNVFCGARDVPVKELRHKDGHVGGHVCALGCDDTEAGA